VENINLLDARVSGASRDITITSKLIWRFIKASYKASVFNGYKLEILESVICEILSVNEKLSFIEIGKFLGLLIEDNLDKGELMDNAEKDVLNKLLNSLIQNSEMVQLDDNYYSLSEIGKKYWSKDIKIKKIPNLDFVLYFDVATSNHSAIFKYFSDSYNIFPSEESSWRYPDIREINQYFELQVPFVYSDNPNKVAFYKGLEETGFQECYVEVDVKAISTDGELKLFVLWEGKINEELSAIVRDNDTIYSQIIGVLNLELIETWAIPFERSVIESYKYKINWTRFSKNLKTLENPLIQKFLEYWDWEVLASREDLDFNNKILSRFEDKWKWNKLSENRSIILNPENLFQFSKRWNWNVLTEHPSFPKNLNTILLIGGFLKLNKVIGWLNESEILNKSFEEFVEKNIEKFTPISSENTLLNSKTIKFWDSLNLIKWKSERWTTWETHTTRVKAFEGSDDYTVEVEHCNFGLIDNANIEWDFYILSEYWDKIQYEHLDSKTKKVFSKNISLNLKFNKLSEIELNKEIIDWDLILLNKSLTIDSEFLRVFQARLNWPKLTKNFDFIYNIFLLEEFKENWDWEFISSQNKIDFSVNFILKFRNNIDWRILSRNNHLNYTIEILEASKDKIEWDYVSQSNKLDFNIIERFKDYLSWILLSANKNLRLDSLKISKFKQYWNWGELSRNSSIEIDSYILKEFEEYWDWSEIAVDKRINQFLSKFNWSDLSPADQDKLLINFLKQYHEKWSWKIIKSNSYISFKYEYLSFFKSKEIWEEIAQDDRFILSTKNIEVYEDKLSWDALSHNPKLIDAKNISRFIDKWNWNILSQNIDLISDFKVIDQFRDYWNWDVLSTSFTSFTNDILLKYKGHWNLKLIDYKKLVVNERFLIDFSDELDWDSISSGRYLSFNTKLLNQFKDYFNWDLLAKNDSLKLTNNILSKFSDRLNIPLERYNEISFNQIVLKYYIDRLNWDYVSESASFDLDPKILNSFQERWNWQLLQRNPNLKFSYLVLSEFFEKWNFDLFDYNKIQFDKDVLQLCEKKLDWDKLSKSGVLNISPEVLRIYSEKWNWNFLSEKKDWKFDDTHFGLLSEFRDYWNWVVLLRNKNLFKLENPENKEVVAYKIIEYQESLDLNIDEINFSEFNRNPIYYPTSVIEDIFDSKIISKIKDLRETSFHEIILGRESQSLRVVINYGRANFDEPYEDVSADEKVLIYCYLNMRKHFFTKIHILNMINSSSVGGFFKERIFISCANLIDVGCGPLTAGLAYADFMRTNFTSKKINYYGVDISESIIRKAKDFSTSTIFTNDSKFSFFPNWRNISLNFENGQPIIFIFSYLFANLNEKLTIDLAEFTQEIISKFEKNSPIILMFQNPVNSERNTMFDIFFSKVNIKIIGTGIDIVRYRNRTFRNSLFEPSSEEVKYVIMANEVTANSLLSWKVLNN